MMDTDTTSPHAPERIRDRIPLHRPRSGRVVAGVAAGVAQRLDIPVWSVRAALILLTIPGGFGIALYVAGWLVIPDEGAPASIASDLGRRTTGTRAWIGIALIGVAVLVVANTLDFVRRDLALAALLIVVGVLLYRGDLGRREAGPEPEGEDRPTSRAAASPTETAPAAAPPPPPEEHPVPAPPPPPGPREPRSILGRVTFGLTVIAVGVVALAESLRGDFDPSARHYLGLALAMLGAGLVVGAFVGRARGLIVLGALLIPPLLISPLADLDVPGSFGERVYSPDTVAEIRPVYELGFGHLVLDFTDVDFGGDAIAVEADLGVGQVEIFVPEGVAVEAEGRAGAGSVVLFGNERSGVGIRHAVAVAGDAGHVSLDARVNAGEIRVHVGRAAPRLSFSDLDLAVDGPADLRGEYRLDSGNLVLDLSDLELDTFRRVQVGLGRGEMRVVLPDDITSRVDARVGIGDLNVLGRLSDGLDLEDSATWGEGRVLLQLDLEVGAGSLVVEGGMR